jgi:hypothetical protein
MYDVEDEIKEEIDAQLAKAFFTVCLLGFMGGVLAGLGAAVLIAESLK